ncbi:MAG TPA: DUF72 domain-containing protein [Myxococcales bacterium]
MGLNGRTSSAGPNGRESSAASTIARVGTAGWAIPRAVAASFPGEGPALARYSRVFNALEINSSFWRRHKPATWQRWADTVPDEFRFSVKLPRTITHERKLLGSRKCLDEFFADVGPLRHKLGPILVQLPPSLAFDARRAGAFFKLLRARHQREVVCEPRHPSWFGEAADALWRDFEIARVAADPARVPLAAEPGGSPALAYYRMHGSPRMYYSEYGAARIRELAAKLGVSNRPVWCLFDNTASGAGAADALLLHRLLSAGH